MGAAAFSAGMWLVCACLTQDMPVPVFRTTVVGNVGLRGIIYYLKPNTGVLPDSFHRFKPKGEGKFWIEKAGTYRFALTSDDGSLLYIDDMLPISNDGDEFKPPPSN